MSDPQSKDHPTNSASDASDDKRRDEVLKRMLATKPTPHVKGGEHGPPPRAPNGLPDSEGGPADCLARLRQKSS